MEKWAVDFFIVRADSSDVAYAKTEGRKLRPGDELSRVPRGVGPICPDHDHWAGSCLSITANQAEFVSKACAAYEEAGHKWPED